MSPTPQTAVARPSRGPWCGGGQPPAHPFPVLAAHPRPSRGHRAGRPPAHEREPGSTSLWVRRCASRSSSSARRRSTLPVVLASSSASLSLAFRMCSSCSRRRAFTWERLVLLDRQGRGSVIVGGWPPLQTCSDPQAPDLLGSEDPSSTAAPPLLSGADRLRRIPRAQKTEACLGPPLAPRSPRRICCPLLPPRRAPWLCPHDYGWLFTPGCGDEPPEQQEVQGLGASAEGTRAGRGARPCRGAGWGRGVRHAPGKGQPLCDCGPLSPQGRPMCGCSRGPQTLQSPYFSARLRGHRDFSAPLCSGGISLLEVFCIPCPYPPLLQNWFSRRFSTLILCQCP